MPPPPPPPPAPPPPPLQLFQSKEPSKSRGPETDRNALLSEIRKGTRLKKSETNDRSSPLVAAGAKPAQGNSGNSAFKANGPSMIPPGGLFAQGIPKLRPTGTRTESSRENFPSHHKSDCSGRTFSSLESNPNVFLVHEISGSRSHPPSPASKLRQGTAQPLCRTDSIGEPVKPPPGPPACLRNFPSDVNIKGPAPVPPPASQKPSFKISNSSVSQGVSQVNSSSPAGKHPGVRRSVSQTSLGPRPRPSRPPPSVRPPPPPKVLQNGPPPPPSKPPNILRRQSFGVADIHENSQSSSPPVVTSDMTKHGLKLLGPPPPPRNNSAPYNLNQMNNTSPVVGHVNKMAAPPPPPPPFRVGMAPTRPPSVRPPPPPTRAPAPPVPPPPPHRHSGFPAPPSLLKATPENSPPPAPPTRVSSAKHISCGDSVTDFEARYLYKFHSAQNLPNPEPFSNSSKSYPSETQKMRQQSIRRQPPPPPPSLGNGTTPSLNRSGVSHQPVLHIQLESRVFASNIAHC